MKKPSLKMCWLRSRRNSSEATRAGTAFDDSKCRLTMIPPRDMTVEQVRQILSEVAEALEAPDTFSRLDQAKVIAGHDVVKKLKIVYPIIRQVQLTVIERHGFDNTTEGLVQFTERVREVEGRDTEVARLHLLIRNHYLSPDSISSMVDMLTRA